MEKLFVFILMQVVPGDLTLLIAFHNSLGGRVEGAKEYQYTTTKCPNPDEVVYIHRSVGVGKVFLVTFSLPHKY